MPLAGMTKEQIKAAVDFIHGHYETGPGQCFLPTPVDPDTWWEKMTLVPKDPESLRPNSKAHFEARKARWVKIMLEETQG